MECRDCARFDTASNRCKDRKVNPRTYDQAFQVAQFYGVRSICVFNDHRERLLHSRKTVGPSR
jgi:hypothetical protein